MPPRHRDLLRLPLLAGWLFADLMLVLFIISLSFVSATDSGSSVPSPTPTPTPITTPTPTPTPTPTTSPTPHQRVLLPQHYQVTMDFPVSELLSGDPGGAADEQLAHAANRGLDSLVADHPALADKLVAVAVIFGIGPESDIGNAITEATEAGTILHAHDRRFGQSSFLDYWSGAQSTENSLELVMFFYAS
jgi:hypothetical protein